MNNFPKKLAKKLASRESENALRTLPIASGLVDFSSNDYLGFSAEETIFTQAQQLLSDRNIHANGATGSRLITGNHNLYTTVETKIKTFHKSEEALVFNSGYDANIGFFSSVPQRGDVVLFDEFIHASIRDGIQLSNSKSYKFKHNDLKHLETLITKFSSEENEIYVVTEAVFSMDGDSPDLKALAKLCSEHQVCLVVDEAHSVGVYGTHGEGLVSSLSLEASVFARIITFGKAFGCHGACILGSEQLKSYLINFSRSFIYTTGLPPHSLATILSVYLQLENKELLFEKRQEKLKANIQYFQSTWNNLFADNSIKYIKSESAIQCFVIPGNERVKLIAEKLKEKGYNVKPILSPTIPKGEERLRFCMHSFNTFDEISEVLNLLLLLI
ncbi:aminotransferase class I/II-fold pyridoxal phosphate-dependent enzyme [Joostella sp. CR20]|uniref:aminotransferase class I/II-fold pyridoxal phosphate-dependent enzyme n=1 Tax=Joostella sp. CR20 TaxID=2804312 RepID=UPI00313EF2AD